MNRDEFIQSIKEVVAEPAKLDSIEYLLDPPRRNKDPKLLRQSAWIKNMSKDDLEILKSIVSDAVDDSVFGLLCVLDGVRAFSNEEDELRLLLKDSSGKEVLLNNTNEIDLHDLYNNV
jgi:hypothetical protein